jgi:DNA-binding transcriptional LysR family regulator
MDVGALTIFVTVAELGSISQAAQQLGYVQSNVTARMQNLEEQLQTPLFYRRKRGMVLTPAGRTLLGYARRVLHLVDEARRAVQEHESDQIQGSLIIGSMETTAAVRLPNILAQYHQSYPAVELTLKTGPTAALLDDLLSYQLDGAFVGGSVTHPELEQEIMFDEELVFITDRQGESLEDLPQRTMLAFRQGCSYRARLEQVMHERGLIPCKVIEFGTLEALLACVAAGMGVTLFPRSTLVRLNMLDRLRIHTLPATVARIPTMFVRRRDALQTRAMDAFMELTRQAGAGLEAEQDAAAQQPPLHSAPPHLPQA